MRIIPILILAAIASADAFAQRSAPKSTKDSAAPKVTYTRVDAMPTFNGNINADILAHLRFPEPCMGISPEKCVATFTVEPSGLLSELTIARGSGCAPLDSEVVRLLSPMTRIARWTPGRIQGRPAAIRYALPVMVHLDD